MITTSKDIQKSYTDEKKALDYYLQPWAYFAIRPLSFYLTPWFIKKGWSATQTTLYASAFLIVGLGLIALSFGSILALLIGAILINIWYLLDFVDGNIARHNNETSERGALIDSFFGHIYSTLLPVAAGFSALHQGDNETLQHVAFFAGLLTGFLRASRAAISKTIKLKKQSQQEIPIPGFSARLGYAVESFASPALLIFSAIGFLNIWLNLYLFLALVSWLYTVKSVFNKSIG